MKQFILTILFIFIFKNAFAIEVNGKLKDECKYLVNLIERNFRDIKKDNDRGKNFDSALVGKTLKAININYILDTYKKMCD